MVQRAAFLIRNNIALGALIGFSMLYSVNKSLQVSDWRF